LCSLGFSPFWKSYWDTPNLVPSLSESIANTAALSSIIAALTKNSAFQPILTDISAPVTPYLPHILKKHSHGR